MFVTHLPFYSALPLTPRHGNRFYKPTFHSFFTRFWALPGNFHSPILFLHFHSSQRSFEYLRLTSLGVIGALVKTDENDVINFLLTTEIVPLCLNIMDNGSGTGCRLFMIWIRDFRGFILLSLFTRHRTIEDSRHFYPSENSCRFRWPGLHLCRKFLYSALSHFDHCRFQ